MKKYLRIYVAIIILFFCTYMQVQDVYSSDPPADDDTVIVTFNPIVLPSITIDGASLITGTTARLNGSVTDTGNDDPDITIYYGLTDEGQVPGSWDDSIAHGTEGVGSFFEDVAGLSETTLYYYIIRGVNNAGTVWTASANFTTTATLEPPYNIVATDLGGSTINIQWTKGAGSTYSMFRVSRQQYPEDVDEYEQIYYGDRTSANFTWAITTDEAWISAWGYASDNTTYSSTYNTTRIGGTEMFLGVLVLLALSLTIAGYLKRQPILTIAGAGAWAIFGIYSYGLSVTPDTGTWDIYYAIFFLSMGMILLCILEPVIMKPQENPKEDLTIDEVDKTESDMQKLMKGTRIPRLGGNPRRKRPMSISQARRKLMRQADNDYKETQY